MRVQPRSGLSTAALSLRSSNNECAGGVDNGKLDKLRVEGLTINGTDLNHGVAMLGSAPNAGARPVELLFNWILPVLLVLGAVTQHAADTAGDPAAKTSSAAHSSR